VVTPPLLLLAAAVATAACSGKPRPDGAGSAGVGDSSGSSVAGSGTAGSAVATGSAGSAGAAGSAAGQAGSGSKLGDVQIRVEWADVPSDARASPGRTPCNTPRSPSVTPTPTWGIPDAIVLVEGARVDSTEAHIVLADCALSPRVAAGESLVIESAADRPASVALTKRADLSRPQSLAVAAVAAGPAPRLLRLPIAGHAVAVSLDPGGVYELATTDKDPETAWLAVPPAGAAAAVTDTSGQAVLRGLSPGPHAVTAWLPPRAGQAGHLARGTVTVAPGDLTELTVALSPASPPAP
jgi:hypothetical protein